MTQADSYRRSVRLTVDLAAIRHNMACARSLSGSSRLFATVKADAYGHGAVAVARALSAADDEHAVREDERADGFAVVTLEEALELRDSGIRQPILVLQGPRSAVAAEQMVQAELWPVLHDHQQYAWYRRHPARQQLGAWLKVDTGMGRLGFAPREAIGILDTDDGIRWIGLLTHFASADETGNPLTLQQLCRFQTVSDGRQLMCSLANSAAILAWPQTRADWVRPGIMLYGCNPLDIALPEGVELIPAMTVESPLIAVKSMARGTGIGYAQSYHCEDDMRVGYVAAGYRDGIPRVLDASATVAIDGQACAILGRVSMDSIAIDLRSVPQAQPGTIVELWGRSNSVESLARSAGTISYELLTSVRGAPGYLR